MQIDSNIVSNTSNEELNSKDFFTSNLPKINEDAGAVCQESSSGNVKLSMIEED